MCGIKLEKKRGGFDRCQIIDGNNGQIVARSLQQGAQHIASNPSKPVYGNPFHLISPA